MKRLLLVALLCSACVTTAQEGEQMRQDIAALRTDLKKEIDTASADRQKLSNAQQQRSKALQEAPDQLSPAAPTTRATPARGARTWRSTWRSRRTTSPRSAASSRSSSTGWTPWKRRPRNSRRRRTPPP